ncbi:MAG: CRISPR-associated helicase Cas3' [Candidatus Heimdallarchaeum aukensis]|uniref:CRISPR-associated helicase Cas3 n=1 Tax=Candidatus Heimdallarchaeum aukensis TaxID=2876573 RepID=A0A9Y1FLE7_9ARCH|nr:MAG: CRISPR-associated helicase Cas3' [Candidatus Heimdallarchaeum aukensis]
MTNSSVSSENQINIFSHPNKNILEHLSETEREILNILEKLQPNFSIKKNIIIEIARILALTHDIGKCTIFFQEYLHSNEENNFKKLGEYQSSKLHHHGLISAVFTYYTLKKLLNSNNEQFYDLNSGYKDLLPHIGFLTTKKHHGNLGNFYDEIIINRTSEEKIRQQLENFHPQFENVVEFIRNKINITISFNEFSESFGDLIDELAFSDELLLNYYENSRDCELYLFTLFLHSILTDADKTSAIGVSKPILPFISSNKIIKNRKKIIQKKGKKTYLDNLRENIYKEVIAKIEKTPLDNKIFTLTAPTGSGKTLTVFEAAFRLKDKILRRTNIEMKIIYCLPFLSIIDQNAHIINQLLDPDSVKFLPSTQLLIHHYLAEVQYSSYEEDYTFDESRFLIEDWHSSVIITTFIQLFHSIFTNRNSKIRKHHNIQNSIIILDEVQNIPHKYWLLIREVFQRLSEIENVYIIFTTATQPKIFSSEEKVVELLENKEKYFEQLSRITLEPKIDNNITLNEFILEINEKLQKNSDKDILIVANTIREAQEIFDSINFKKDHDKLFFLSSQIIPRKRKERIEEIKRKLEKEKDKRESNEKRIILVTTQLIEAGVDIDFDIVIRDLGPIDSINQVAGRCNRNGEEEKGKTIVYSVIDQKTKRLFASYIYDGFILSKTKDVLKNKRVIEEQEFLKIIDDYYLSIEKTGDTITSTNILDSIFNLEFDEIGKFSLIEERADQVPVFIEIDKKAKEIWAEYLEIWNIKDWKKRNEKFIKIKNDLYSNLINVDKKKIKTIEQIKGYYYIDFQNARNYYDNEKGFIGKEKDVILL